MTKFSITSRGQELWNNFINNETKLITNISRFKKLLNSKYSIFKTKLFTFESLNTQNRYKLF